MELVYLFLCVPVVLVYRSDTQKCAVPFSFQKQNERKETKMQNTETKTPRMMTIREIAKTGLLPEHALRLMVKNKQAPHIMVGNKALVNYDKLVAMLQSL